MSGFKIPSYLNENDKTIVYEKIFGLTWDDNSGIIAKIGYYLSRTWIHIRGNVDTSILKNQILNDKQKAVVFAAIYDNVECFRIYKGWLERWTDHEFARPYRDDNNVIEFLRENGAEWGRFNSIANSNEFVSYIAFLGSEILLEKMLELKPQKMDGTNDSNQTLIREAVFSGDIAIIKFLLNKNIDVRNVNFSTRLTSAKTLLDCTLERFRGDGDGLNKEKHDTVFKTLVETKKFSEEEILSVLLRGTDRLTPGLYTEFLPSLLKDKTEKEITKTFATLIYSCLDYHGKHNQEMVDFFLQYSIDNYPKLNANIVAKCNKKIADQIKKPNSCQYIPMLGWLESRFVRMNFEKGILTATQVLEKLQTKESLNRYSSDIYRELLPKCIEALQKDEEIKEAFSVLITNYVGLIELIEMKHGTPVYEHPDKWEKLIFFKLEVDKLTSELKSQIIEEVQKKLQDKIAEFELKAKEQEKARVIVGAEAKGEIRRYNAGLNRFKSLIQ